MKLYEINEQIRAVMATLEPNEHGADVVSLHVLLNELSLEKEQKLINIHRLIKEIEADAVAIKAEEARLSALRKQAEKKVESLKEYVVRFGLAQGEKFSAQGAVFSWRKSVGVEVVDESIVPEEYLRVKTSIEVDKSKAKDALSLGVDIPGLEYYERQNLQVK